MLNKKVIIRVLGFLLLIEAFFLLISMAVDFIYKDDVWRDFLISILITAGVGGLMFLFSRGYNKVIAKREAFIIVSFTWVVFSIVGALPFYISGYIPSYTDAFFETISGFTTTGASILRDIEALPEALLFWRSLTQWIGGMGIIVLSLALLPIFAIGGMELFAAEVPGPTADKITPRVRETAKLLWEVYLFLTVLETILLKIAGMTWFDAINHAFTTMATGGYSTKQASIAYWQNPAIHYIIAIFMILAGTNFSVNYFFLKGKFKQIRKNEEFKVYIGLTFFFTISIAALLLIEKQDMSVEKAFRDALFQVSSIMTTTGYATQDYWQWAHHIGVFIFLIMFFGGSAGSTGGGIKTARIILVTKSLFLEFKKLLHPNAVIPVRLNKKSVDERIVRNVLIFVLAFLIIFFTSSLIMAFLGLDMVSAMGAVIACLGNIGPGLAKVGPAENYAFIPDIGKWFLSFLMLIGRLELFTVLILFTPAFWKK